MYRVNRKKVRKKIDLPKPVTNSKLDKIQWQIEVLNVFVNIRRDFILVKGRNLIVIKYTNTNFVIGPVNGFLCLKLDIDNIIELFVTLLKE